MSSAMPAIFLLLSNLNNKPWVVSNVKDILGLNIFIHNSI